MEMFSLKNKTAVVTGALGLIGRQHCIALANAGANVVAADLDKHSAQKFALSLNTESIGVEVDVSNKNSLIELVNCIKKEFNGVDILVNNAAINDMFENPKTVLEESKFENYPLNLWQRSIDINLTGVFLCCQVIGSEMAKKRKGSIINIASTYGITAPDQSLYINPNGDQVFYKPPAYAVSKAGVIMLTKYLASYWGKTGIRVNTLSPGGVRNNQDEFFIEKYSSRTTLGRMAEPHDYIGALVFLASDASSYMNGANLVVDGGWTIW